MKKKLTLWILFFPLGLFAQQIKNGTIIFDMNGKKKAPDTTQQQYYNPYESDEDYLKENSAKKKSKNDTNDRAPSSQSVHEYWRTHGLFQPVFHAGINACQVDGDGYSGYNYVGAEFGIGAQIKVHRILSVSVGLDYSMKGAKQGHHYDSTLAYSTTYTSTLQDYQVQFDYLQIPIGLNIDAVNVKSKQLMYLTFGLTPSILVRYKEIDENGNNRTTTPPEGQPRRFDLDGFGGIYFIIHRNFVLGGQFSYSAIRIRGPYLNGLSRMLGEYNNVITFDFKYVLDAPKKGGTKKNKR